MKKIINNTSLVPVTITDLVLENTVAEGSTNPPTTDAVAKAIEAGAGSGIESDTITSAEIVNSLPANPDADTLYLIPEA